MQTGEPPKDQTCRGQITIAHVGRAVETLGSMDFAQKEQLADEIVREQPALFSSFLAQRQFAISFEKMEFLLNILFACFLAMKETQLHWPKIMDDDVDACMARYVESVKFGMNIDPAQRQKLVQQFVDGHPEPVLLAYVQVETANWLKRVSVEESDRFVMLAAVNMVNCIGYASGIGSNS